MTTPEETSPAPTEGAGAPPPDREAAALGYLLAKAGEIFAKAAVEAHATGLRATRSDKRPVLAAGDRQSAFLAGRRLGAVRMDKGATTAKVDPFDPEFVAWVKNNPRYAHNIREVVEPAFAKKLQDHAKKVGEPITVHGEVVPGLTVRTGDPKPVQELVEDFATVIAAAIRASQLSVSDLFPLPLTAPTSQLEEGPDR